MHLHRGQEAQLDSVTWRQQQPGADAVAWLQCTLDKIPGRTVDS